jgi:type IV pilus assembly protein PilB
MNATVSPTIAGTTMLSGLARALVQGGKISQTQALELSAKATHAKTQLIDELLQSRVISARELAHYCAVSFSLPLLDLEAVDLGQLTEGIIDPKLLAQHRVLGLKKREKRTIVAISDPTNLQAVDQIKFQAQMPVDLVVVEHDKLLRFLEQRGQSNASKLNELAGDDINLDDIEVSQEDTGASVGADSEVDDAPVVRFLQKMLIDGINMGASDLHFEPYEKTYRIRYRVDGVLKEIAQPPVVIKEKLASRIKVISKLDISEKRIPQDGRMKLVLGPNRAIDFRVSTLPTLFGEKIVMRILDPSQAKLGIDALGYEPDEKAILMEAIHRPYGMVLVTGPTGSGKTVSLYTCLNILNQPGINISTAEDPAEIQLQGINQVNVNDKAGLSFAAALKAFLRQDPDIIMVGEIRDLETADISIKAAQTGHMVFSTLHTNDAPTTLTRLANMGVPAFNIASSVILITAQRLARRLCAHCKAPASVEPGALLQAGFKESDLDGSWAPYKPVGCQNCNHTGYKGRVGIYQVMPISEEMQRIILSNGTAMDIADQAAREGIRTLRQSGLLKVKQGLTSLEEVLGVTND